jgi:hypothetical protein
MRTALRRLAFVKDRSIVHKPGDESVVPRRWSVVGIGTGIGDDLSAVEADVYVKRIEMRRSVPIFPSAQKDDPPENSGGGPP